MEDPQLQRWNSTEKKGTTSQTPVLNSPKLWIMFTNLTFPGKINLIVYW